MALPKPDPSRYRGGSTSSSYKQDLLNWQQTQQPTVEPVGQEEVVSLNSSFDEEPDAFAPIVDYNALANSDFTVDYTNMDLSSLNEMFDQDAVLPEGFTEYTGGTLGENFVPDWWPTYEEGVYAGQPVHYANLNDSQKELAKEYYTWADSFIEEGGSFGTGANLGDPANPLYFREQASTELYNSMTKQLEDLGLTPDDIDGDLLEMARMSSGSDTADQTERDTGYELFIRQVNPYITEKNQAERQALYDLLDTGDMESFKSEFSSADINTQANLMYRLYSEGTLSKDEYRTSMAGVHQEANPDYLYFFDDDELFRVAKKTYEEDPDFAMSRGAIEYIRLFPDSGAYNYTDSEDVRGMDWEEQFARSLGVPTKNYHFSDDDSGWVNARDKVILPLGRVALATITKGMSEKLYTAYKIAAGETLHGSDYANLVIGGLEQAGVIGNTATFTDPVTGVTHTVEANNGLLGLGYDQTVGVIEAIGNQDVVGLVTNIVDDGMITGVLEDIGLPTALANDPDFISGVTEAVTTIAGGGDLNEAVEDGFVEYVREGGGFGGLPETDIDIDLSAITDVVAVISDTVGDVTSAIGDYIDPITSAIGDVGSEVEDVVRDVGSTIDDTIIEPAKEFVESIETPDVDFPSIDLNLQLPQLAMPSATRTTDSLFSDLFKFKTQIGISPDEELLTYNELKGNNPFGRTI